jgi:phosphatidyl-myo-inositol alpha-mannosyltransferase
MDRRRPLRICIVVPYDLGEEGGVKRHALHVAESLRRLGDEVVVTGPLRRGRSCPEAHGFGGVVNVRANGADNHVAVKTPPWDVWRFFRSGAFDVVHIHEPLVPLLPNYALLFSRSAAHVCTFHMYEEAAHSPFDPWRRFCSRWLFPRFERGIAVSEPAALTASRFWTRPLTVIPNGVPTRTFRPPEDRGAGDGTLRLLFVGHWRDPRKGLPHLLEAHRRLTAKGLRVHLDVVGAGDPSPVAEPNVTFHGPVSSEAVLAEHYRRCDLFVAPATGQESFGIVLLEAMACARPVVCSDIPGYRQVVDPAGACLVPPGDAEALADAIARLAKDSAERRRMGERNRSRAEAFDWDRLVGRVRDEYEGALVESWTRRTASADPLPARSR